MLTHLNFWGTTVQVDCCAADVEELRFFYGQYLTDPMGAPDVSVVIGNEDWPSRGFFASSLARDGLRKHIAVVDHVDSRRNTAASFTDWSGMVSPFPPFATTTLASRLAVFPGAIVRAPNGMVVGLLGDHYVGKTATALALCREHGAQLISDSVMVVDVGSMSCLTFESPVGLRREGLRQAVPMLDRVQHRLTVSSDTGLVALVRPIDLLGTHNSCGGRIDKLVLLSSTESVGPVQWGISETTNVGWFTGASREEVDRALPRSMLRLEASSKTTPPERAKHIAQKLWE